MQEYKLTFPVETMKILNELKLKTGMDASLLLAMGLVALLDGDLDYITCPACDKWVFVNPSDWRHLKGAVEQVHGNGDTTACPHCGGNLFPGLL